MNFERLSKKAESYSSASTTKKLDDPRRAEFLNESLTPPTKNPTSMPLALKISQIKKDVEVFPCVPDTAITVLSWIISPNILGPEV